MYIIIGTKDSGRREVLFNFIYEAERFDDIQIFIANDESKNEFEEKLSGLTHVKISRYAAQDLQEILEADYAEKNDQTFLLLNSQEDLLGQIDTVAETLPQSPNTLDRILFVMDCDLAMREPKLKRWFQAATYFADCVLLNKRTNVNPGWMRDWLEPFQKECYPCLFVYVKKGRVENPELVLSQSVLRMTLAFEDDYQSDQHKIAWTSLDNDQTLDDETSFTESGDIDDDSMDADAEDSIPEDPFLAKHLNGDFKVRLPDPNKFL